MEKPLKPQQDGPFIGMLASERVDAPAGFLLYLQNGYVDGGEVVGRSGLASIGSALPNDVQGVYQWEMLDGTQYTCVFADGDLYTYDFAADTFTQFDLSAEGLSVSTTGDINCCTSRGRLIFTDGVNQPIMLEGPLDGTETYTTLTNAPIANRVGIYYAKVFFWDIPNYENEFHWSNEGDPINGYAGENQAWEFAQTDAGRILGMALLNKRAVVLKEDSATYITGAVEENFQALAVREGLSETEGTIAGGSVVISQGDVYCLAPNGPRIAQKGQVYQSIHEDPQQGIDYLREVWADVDRSNLDKAIGWLDTVRGHIGWLVPFDGESGRLHKAIVYDTRYGSWSVFDFGSLDITAVGSVEDHNGKDWVVFGDADGKAYKYNPDEAVYSDAGSAITRIYRGRLMGGGVTHLKKRLTEIQLLFYLKTNFNGMVKINVDGDLGWERSFGHTSTGKKRYRRGCNQVGYTLGWELRCDSEGETVTLSKATSMMTVVEMSDDWNG